MVALISRRGVPPNFTNQFMREYCHFQKILVSTRLTITKVEWNLFWEKFLGMYIDFKLFSYFRLQKIKSNYFSSFKSSFNLSGRTQSSVREEKLYNLRLTKSEEEFVNIMENLGNGRYQIKRASVWHFDHSMKTAHLWPNLRIWALVNIAMVILKDQTIFLAKK